MNTRIFHHTPTKIENTLLSHIEEIKKGVGKACNEILDPRNIFLHGAGCVGIGAGYVSGDPFAGLCIGLVSTLAITMPWFLMRFTEESSKKNYLVKKK